VTEEGDRHARFSDGVALSLFRMQVELKRRGCRFFRTFGEADGEISAACRWRSLKVVLRRLLGETQMMRSWSRGCGSSRERAMKRMVISDHRFLPEIDATAAVQKCDTLCHFLGPKNREAGWQ